MLERNVAMLETSVIEYLADACLGRIREEGLPEARVCAGLNTYPLIDSLRARLREDDLVNICDVAKNGSGSRPALAISLLRKFSTRAEVRQLLFGRWGDGDTHIRLHVMWRLLDDANLELHWHEQLFEFALANWEDFSQQQLAFTGGPSAVLGGVVCRMADPSFPESKMWSYLCCLPEADDRRAALALIRQAEGSTCEFTRRVAQELRSRFF